MKIKQIFTICAAIIAVSACTPEKSLEQLKSDRDKLLVELDELEEKINLLAAGEGAEQSALLVSVDTAVIGTFMHQIEIQGAIETDKDVLLNAESGGLIVSVNVKEGQRVSKGQVLAQIDAATISSSIQEIKTALEFAEYNLQKQQELAAQGLGTEFQLQQAKSNVNNLKSQLNSLNTQRGKFVITAPFSGIVDQVYARVGAMAGPQSPVLRLVDNSDVKITADVSERLYARLSLGMPVAVQVPSLNDTVVSLSITQIGNYIHPTNRTFRVQASLKNNKLLLPNMLTRMRITDYINNEALLVPSEAVLIDNVGEQYVYIAEKSKSNGYVAKRINVQVKESFDGLSEIEQRAGGLERGMLVVVRGVRGISENDLLKLMD